LTLLTLCSAADATLCQMTWLLYVLLVGRAYQMSESETWRIRAARFLALALKAREKGDSKLADLLVERAMQYSEKAIAIEEPFGHPRHHLSLSQTSSSRSRFRPKRNRHVCPRANGCAN